MIQTTDEDGMNFLFVFNKYSLLSINHKLSFSIQEWQQNYNDYLDLTYEQGGEDLLDYEFLEADVTAFCVGFVKFEPLFSYHLT